MSDQPAQSPPTSDPTPRSRTRIRRPRRTQLLAGLLLGVLAFSLVIQARQTQEDKLASLRQTDLVRILDDLNQRSARLDEESRQLQRTRDELRSGSGQKAAAEQTARKRLDDLGILAGTVAATGPGIELDIADPERRLPSASLLDAVQELRDAGAEAIQVGNVRVVASTAFVDGTQGILVDGQALTSPYRFLAIGDGQTMASALGIPGGVLEALPRNGATGDVRLSQQVAVTALRQVSDPQYARPAPAGSP